LPGPAEEAYVALAKKLGIWLVPGSLYEVAGDKIYNTTPVIDPQGTVVARYRKMFPFRPYEAGIDAGDRFCMFDVPGVGRFAVSICYDMWVPETTRSLAALGAEVILHPTMTTTLDRDVELAIARANAAQNQCYFFDINGAGAIGNGRSIICGPAGEVLHQAGTTHEVMPIEIDLERVRAARRRGSLGLGQPLKSFRDREVELTVYGERSTFLDSLGPLVKPGRTPTHSEDT
jgi:predicted amidohydrolase